MLCIFPVYFSCVYSGNTTLLDNVQSEFHFVAMASHAIVPPEGYVQTLYKCGVYDLTTCKKNCERCGNGLVPNRDFYGQYVVGALASRVTKLRFAPTGLLP